jgi:hypothetical protein
LLLCCVPCYGWLNFNFFNTGIFADDGCRVDRVLLDGREVKLGTYHDPGLGRHRIEAFAGGKVVEDTFWGTVEGSIVVRCNPLRFEYYVFD